MPKHGELMLIPEGDPLGECDWGDCDRRAVYYRFDQWGHGWLPCCEVCALLPESET